MLSKEFYEDLERMNIRVYALSTGAQIIGKLLDAHENAIELSNVMELKRVITNVMIGDIHTIMIPFTPYSIGESVIVYRTSIMLESKAAIALKKQYCDALLVNKFADLADALDSTLEVPEDDDILKEDKGFDWSNLKNQYPNRNWNN
jgi:hypothetical protein